MDSEKKIVPEVLLGRIVDSGVAMRGGEFPLGAMPMKIQRIVREANDCYGYPVDYPAGAMLVALGLGIGNTHFARLKGKWDESGKGGADCPLWAVETDPFGQFVFDPFGRNKIDPCRMPAGEFFCSFTTPCPGRWGQL